MWLLRDVTINGAISDNVGYGVQRLWCGWAKYCMVKQTHDEATAWFWFPSWPLIWEMMDRLSGRLLWGERVFCLGWSSLICGGKFGRSVGNFVLIGLWLKTIVLLLYFCQDVLVVDCCEGGGLHCEELEEGQRNNGRLFEIGHCHSSFFRFSPVGPST